MYLFILYLGQLAPGCSKGLKESVLFTVLLLFLGGAVKIGHKSKGCKPKIIDFELRNGLVFACFSYSYMAFCPDLERCKTKSTDRSVKLYSKYS